MRAMLIRVAKEWRLKPSELGICSEDDDLTYMVAYLRAESHMTAWESQEAQREAKRRAKRR